MRLNYDILCISACLHLVSYGCSSGSGPGVEALRVEGSLVASPGGDGLPAVANRGAGPIQLRAVATLADGTTEDVTLDAEWAMDDPTGATVDQGVVTPIEPGRNDVTVRYGGVSTTAPFFVVTRISGIPAITIEGTELGVIQFSGVGDSKQLVATTRLPDGLVLDVTDEVPWMSSNPAEFPITEGGVAEALVPQAASDVSVVWRNRRGSALLQVGDPLPQPVSVTVTATRFSVPFSCDSALTADGREGDFTYEISVLAPDGTSREIDSTANYPAADQAVLIDMGDTYVLGDFTTIGVLDYQSIEVELRVTEWDREFEDFGDIIPEPEMNDASVRMVHRGADNFDAGPHEIEIVGSANCEIEFAYRIGTMR